MLKILVFFVSSFLSANALALTQVPLHQMNCQGRFLSNFFDHLTPNPSLNSAISTLGRDPSTFYRFDLVSDVFVSPPTFRHEHTEEYVFLDMNDQGLSVSRFVLSSRGFHLMARHPVELDQVNRVLQYRQVAHPHLPPDWTCRY